MNLKDKLKHLENRIYACSYGVAPYCSWAAQEGGNFARTKYHFIVPLIQTQRRIQTRNRYWSRKNVILVKLNFTYMHYYYYYYYCYCY
jgi:hypothetical protein